MIITLSQIKELIVLAKFLPYEQWNTRLKLKINFFIMMVMIHFFNNKKVFMKNIRRNKNKEEYMNGTNYLEKNKINL